MSENTANERSFSSHILEIRGLQKAFGSLSVLKDISLSVDPGNVVSIIGPSGSGKSTLLRCASFLETANGGDILYDGQYAVENGAYASKADNGNGITKGMVDAFLMRNGLPVYADGSGYPGDKDLHKIAADRDTRLQVFLKQEGDRNFFGEAGEEGRTIEPWPDITCGTPNNRYVTGYVLRKGMSHDGEMATFHGYGGCLVYRAAEAYLNYIEACYEKTGVIDERADAYWKQIRERAGVDSDYAKTVAATRMNLEAEGDWGAWSGGRLVDPTLYNIRRERRCETGERIAKLPRHRQRLLRQIHADAAAIVGIVQEADQDTATSRTHIQNTHTVMQFPQHLLQPLLMLIVLQNLQ